MSKKIRVGVLFGGRSAEHEVSLQSAKNVIEAIDTNKYEVIPIGIDKGGRWHLNESAGFLLNPNDPKKVALGPGRGELAVIPGREEEPLMVVESRAPLAHLDVVFPVLHGTNGEDGSVQGMLQLLDIPCVGASVLGSAVAMDKDVMKRLFRDAGVPIGQFLVLQRGDRLDFDAVVDKLELPFFVKPANAGSSVGVSKVKRREDFEAAMRYAFEYDDKVVVEEFIKGREIEISVLGNEDLKVSLPGEVKTTHEFYSYEAKYLDENGASFEIPAQLDSVTVSRLQEAAKKAFRALCCEGLARVDFFLTDTGQIFVNEINTIPGFTKISMYPKMWQASGLSYRDLIDQLLQLAIEKAKKRKNLKTSF